MDLAAHALTGRRIAMSSSFLLRFEEALAGDEQMAAAMRRLPASVATNDWPCAEQAARREAGRAVRRALVSALRGLLPRAGVPVPRLR
jgi:hypothetical protein